MLAFFARVNMNRIERIRTDPGFQLCSIIETSVEVDAVFDINCVGDVRMFEVKSFETMGRCNYDTGRLDQGFYLTELSSAE